MTYKVTFFCAAVVGAIMMLGANSARAQAWRCVDLPGEFQCQDSLVNDIEDIADRDWPSLDLSMPALPYTCSRKPLIGNQGAEARSASVAGQITWSIGLATDLRSFLLGRRTANADVFGTATVSGAFIAPVTWNNTSINYGFEVSSTEVMVPGGSSGVSDLGAVAFSTPGGALWTDSLRIVLAPGAGRWECTVGPAGASVRANGRGTVTVDYPIALTSTQAAVAEAIRDQFRRAVRIAVLGS